MPTGSRASKKSPPPFIVEGEGEHAVQMLRTLNPMVLVKVDNHLGVGIGSECRDPPPGASNEVL